MKKKLTGTLILGSLLMTGCGNRQIFDTTWSFNKAIITIGYEQIEIEIESWKDYDDTSVQVKAKDGRVYLTDIKNVVLIKE